METALKTLWRTGMAEQQRAVRQIRTVPQEPVIKPKPETFGFY
jgi:hypothetical protein